MSVSANAILQSSTDDRLSVFFGQTFSENLDFNMGPVHVIRNLGDVARVQVDYTADDFQNVFAGNFEDTSVFVKEIVNIVFIITRYLNDFQRLKTVGPRLTRVY